VIRAQESLGIDWQPDGLRAVRLERRLGRIRWRGAVAVPRAGDSPPGTELAALGPVSGAVVLGLPGGQGFVRRLALPAENPGLLRPLLEFELERHLPLPAEKLAFDFAVLGRGPGNRWDLLLAAAPRQTLETAAEALSLGGVRPVRATLTPVAVAALATWAGAPPGPGLVVEAGRGSTIRAEVLEAGRTLWQGERPLTGRSAGEREAIRALAEEARTAAPVRWVLWMGEGGSEPLAAWAGEAGLPCLDPFRRLHGVPAGVDPAYTAAVALALQGLGQGRWRLNLLSPFLPRARRPRQGWTAAVAAVLLASLGAGVWLNEFRLERRALERHLAKLEQLHPQVQVVEAEARRTAALRRLVEALERTNREPAKLALLGELTLLTPRDTWLTRLTYKRGEIEISGYSSSAQELIPRIETSPRFQQAGFSGTIEREGGKERFTIRTRLREPGAAGPGPRAERR